jgi:hypothetical protein
VSGFIHSRWPAYLVGCGLVVAAALPAFGSANRDAYPLSTYPMFARKLGKPQMSVVERLDEKGRAKRLSHEVFGGSEVMQAHRTLRHAVRKGPKAADELCRSIARRIAAREQGKRPVRLRIVRARFDPVAYFSGRPEPEAREVVADCRAGRKR